ncbi:MAG: cyclic nucleotide-binding domain-containing protein [Sulfuritalea sp.]|nr:cyclic nucleotide-binding domain-containing protein [Sulfuritalea sp.]
MTDKIPLVIVGAGPAGLAAAARAAQVGVSHLLLEAGPEIAHTIRCFPKGKIVMAEPTALPLRSSVGFLSDSSDVVLRRWSGDLAASGAVVRTNAKVVQVAGQRGDFSLKLADGDSIAAEQVIIAIGRQGSIRRLDVPGSELTGVQYQLDDPDEYVDETIVVVGAGDSSLENALALTPGNRVILVSPHDDFINCGDVNLGRLKEALAADRLEALNSARIASIDISPESGRLNVTLHSSRPIERLECHRIIARIGTLPVRQTLEKLGIVLPGMASGEFPRLSEGFESEIPGLFIIGALAGCPLIKQALNQGYEVVEYLRGCPVPPADDEALWTKLNQALDIDSVAAGIDLVRQRLPLLDSLNALQLREVLRDSEIRAPQPGEVIFRRNDFGDSFFSILGGSVSVRLTYPDGKSANVTLGAGEFFGELGLLSGRRRSGTVISGIDCVLVETPRRAMLRLLDLSPRIQRQLDEVAMRRALASCFGTALPDDQVELLVNGAHERSYAAGDALFRQGDAADGLYLIRRGSVTVSHTVEGREVVIAYVAAGNYVGEMALVSGQPRSATVRAAGPTEAVLLEAVHFRAMMERNPEARSDIARRYLEGLRAISAGTGSQNGNLVEFLVARGGGEATDMLLIDYEMCIRCDNCERACANVHDGTSRLVRQAGQTFGTMHIPTSCRHCEHPQCMKDCPPDAIHRSPQGEIFISDSCIGCGNCQSNCPYGVIQMAVPQEYVRRTLVDIVIGRAPRPRVRAENTMVKAVKCDMCRGIVGEAACVRECPTGAARRVNPDEFHLMAGI